MAQTLIICNSVELLRLHAADIVSIEADGNYSVLHVMGDEQRTVLFQLGQLEKMISEQLGNEASSFIRVGRGLIINRNYIYCINLNRQHLIMRDAHGQRYPALKAPNESLKKLKELVEGEDEKDYKYE